MRAADERGANATWGLSRWRAATASLIADIGGREREREKRTAPAVVAVTVTAAVAVAVVLMSQAR